MSDNSPSNACPKCGAVLPSAATSGLCPRCLMAEAMTPTKLDTAPSSSAKMLTPAELAPHFPQLEILECFGRGGMGVVYKARQKTLNRLVALKLLAPERVTDAKFAERFTHEAQALAALNHPSIVTIHDFGQAGGFYYLLMEFVDGVNLRQAMKAGRFTPEQALAVVPPVCEALQYAHEHGIVHRDIKPENLLLDKEGRVKIADFGIAKMLGDTAGSVDLAESQPAGTPQYMAPEQKAHAVTDHRADIYSLGVVLYELLTGELPADKLQPPSRKVQIDVRLDEIVLRALEVKPELRYQTAGEFRTQVETVTGRPTPRELPESERPRATSDVSASSTWLPYLGLFAVLAGLWWTYLWWHDPVEGPSMRPVGVIVTVVGLFLMLKGLIQADRSPGTQAAAASAASPAANRESRFSRAAIVGACLAPIFFVAFLMYFTANVQTSPGEYHGPPLLQKLAAVVLGGLGITAPFGTTMLGWISVTQIRRSAGKLYGLGLAVFDGLLFPLLALNVAVWLVVGNLFRANPPQYGTALGAFLVEHKAIIPLSMLLVCLAVDLFIIRRVWRAVNPMAGSADAAPRPRGSGWRKAWISAGIAALIAIVLRIFFVGAYVISGSSAEPELPAGSRILVWKLTHAFAPGDMIAYDHEGSTFVGRVIRDTDAAVTVNRNGQPDESIPHARVTGKVISVYWRATPPFIADRAAASFGPVIEREIPFGRASLNLGTGILTPLPGMALAAEARREHGDVFQPATESNTNALAILNARVLDLDEAAWTNLSATALEEKFAQDAASRRTSQGQSQTRIPPGVYGFKTFDKTGLLQVMGLTGPKPGQFSGVMVRYKLVQNSPVTPKAFKPIPPDALVIMDAIKALPQTFVVRDDDPDPVKSILAVRDAKAQELVALLKGTVAQPLVDRTEELKRELSDTVNPPDTARREAINKEGEELEQKLRALAQSAAPPSFGPMMESVLPFGAPCDRLMLQFRTGRLFVNGHGPGTTKEQSEADWKIIDEAGGVDAQAYGIEDGVQFDGEGCVFLKMEKPGWDDVTPADVASFLEHGSMTGLLEIRQRKDLPVAAFFKTARGETGVLQLLDIAEDARGFHGEGQKGHGVKLRYRLVQGDEAKLAAAKRAVTDDSISLAQAVNDFNKLHHEAAAVAKQPDLTVEAVLAAIRLTVQDRAQLSVTNATFAALGRLIETQVLPKDFALELLTKYEDDQMTRDVWSVRLCIPGTVVPGGTTSISIHEQLLGTHIIGEEERKVIHAWREKERKQGGIGSFERAEWGRKEREERDAAAAIDAKKKPAAIADPVAGIELKVTQAQLEKTLVDLGDVQSALKASLSEMKETHPKVIELRKKLSVLEQEAERLRALLQQDAPTR
jgi:tRNA A-37 threonylcarbamoyl transferase component Bud32